jgi:hypothetical protein
MKFRLFLTITLFAFAQFAVAQTTGTITVSGTNPEAFSITNTSDGSLSTTINFGTLTPASGSAMSSGTSQVRLRSNKAYNLSAQATSMSFVGAGAAAGGSSIALSDIGFGITSIDATGANVANAAGHTAVALFNYDPAAVTVTNGLTPFTAGTHGTLNDITSNAQILSGPRISSKGNLSTNNNFVLVSMKIATLPQYFTPNTSFSTTVTLTIATQ